MVRYPAKGVLKSPNVTTTDSRATHKYLKQRLSNYSDTMQSLPNYSEIIGPEEDVLIIASGTDYVAHPEKVYAACEHGWVDLDEWR